LFIEQGYDATTCEQIAAVADVGPATFYRHFPTKEALVLDDEYDQLIYELVESQPASIPWQARLRTAFLQGIRQAWVSDGPTLRARTELIMRTPRLRASQWTQQRDAASAILRALEDGKTQADAFEVEVITGAMLAAIVAALELWVKSPAESNLPDMVARAFYALDAGTLLMQ
jgi:AcrR family transcriptional regulator